MAHWGVLKSVNQDYYWDIDLVGDEVLLGRAPDCHEYSQYEDGSVSGRHCRLYLWEGTQAWLDDTSSNGTFVNGTLIGKGNSHQLSDGDFITFVVPSREHEQFSEATIAYTFHRITAPAAAPKKPAARAAAAAAAASGAAGGGGAATAAGGSIWLNVKIVLTGDVHAVEAKQGERTPVVAVKEFFETAAHGYKRPGYVLKFRGKKLEDGKVLADYGIKDGANVALQDV